jgi:nucleotide-binding universal stress UspA family protein
LDRFIVIKSFTTDILGRYERILVPHDGSEMSDRSLKHALYLSKISGAEIVILHVLEHVENILRGTEEEVSLTAEGHMRQLFRRKNKTLQESRSKRSIVYNTSR